MSESDSDELAPKSARRRATPPAPCTNPSLVAAKLSRASLLSLVTVLVRGAHSESAVELERMGCVFPQQLYPSEWFPVILAELEKRLLASTPSNQEFQLAVVALLVSADSGDDDSSVIHTRRHDAAEMSFYLLCVCSHLLPEHSVKSVEDIYVKNYRLRVESAESVFSPLLFRSAMMLYKKHPTTLVGPAGSVHLAYHTTFRWFREYMSTSEMEKTVNCVIECRFLMYEGTRHVFCSRLRNARTDYNAHIVDPALRKLSKARMAWRLMWPRVLALVRIRQLWERAAERMAAPGGAEYLLAQKRFKKAASEL